MTDIAILIRSYYPPPAIGAQPPVHVAVYFDPEDVDRTRSIPRWPYRVEITLADFRGIARAGGGTVEALNEEQAKHRVYCDVIEILAELLAERVIRTGPP